MTDDLAQLLNEPQVLVRVVTRDTPTEQCRMGLRNISRLKPNWDIASIRNKYSISINRSNCVREARERGADFLLMLDDDVYPMETVTHLPDHDKPVVGGLIPTWRDGFFFWSAFHLKADNSILYSVTAKGPQGGLEEVYTVGTAVLCIRKDIFMDTSLDPLFSFELNPDGTLKHVLGGEDMFFCRKLQQRGIPVYVDHAVQGEHTTAINFLETLQAGKKHATTDPNHCFPSVFGFDLTGLQIDLWGDSYHARRRIAGNGNVEKHEGKIRVESVVSG